MNMRLCGTDPFAVMKKPHGFRLASLIPPVDRGGARIPACPLGRHPCRRVEPRMPAEPAGKMPALPVLGSWPHLLRKWDWRKRSPTPALSPRRDLPEMKIRASKPLNRGKTSNIQRGHRMAARILAHFDVRCSMLDVRCFPSVQGFDARIFISGGLSMNRPSPGLRPPSPRLAGRGQGEGCQSGSWSQCMRKTKGGSP